MRVANIQTFSIYNNYLTNKQSNPVNFKKLFRDTAEFTTGNFKIKTGTLSPELRQKINNIVTHPETEQPIGVGGTATVYKYENQDDCFAVKIANEKNNVSMEQGVDILAQLPKSMQKNGQKLISHGSINGREFIVTNLVKGSSDKIVQTREQLQSLLLDNLFELDKAGILHNDLWMPNIMVDGDNVNLIDYDYATNFDALTSQDIRQPRNFILNSNLFEFEMSGLETYINALQKKHPDAVRQFFVDYLQVKSEFHNKRTEFLQMELCKRFDDLSNDEIRRVIDAIEYEQVLADVLENPTDEVIDLEAQRIQMLYSFNWSNKNAHFKKPTDAAQCWMRTIIYAKKYEDKIKRAAKNSPNKKFKKYFDRQEKYAEFYTNTFADWGKSTVNWLFDVFSTRNTLSDYDREVYENGMENPMSQLKQGFKQYDDMTDLYKFIQD